MRVLITGGAGYLGSVLVGELLKAEHHVTVLDNLMYGQATALAQYFSDQLFNAVCGDARKQSDMIEAGCRTADVIIPLAAIVGAPACARNPEAYSVNVEALQTLLRCIGGGSRLIPRSDGTSQIIVYPTTNSGYGIGQPGIACTEETPLKPISEYGRQKVEAELEVLRMKNGVSLRLATVFGMSPRMRLDLLVNDFVYRAVNDRFVVLFEPHFKRNYIHVRDVTKAIMFAIENVETMRMQSFNVGLSDANLSKLELCQAIKKHLPDFTFLEAPVGTDPDKRDYIVSNVKIEALGWKPSYTLDDGIKELIKGFRMLKRMEFANA